MWRNLIVSGNRFAQRVGTRRWIRALEAVRIRCGVWRSGRYTGARHQNVWYLFVTPTSTIFLIAKNSRNSSCRKVARIPCTFVIVRGLWFVYYTARISEANNACADASSMWKLRLDDATDSQPIEAGRWCSRTCQLPRRGGRAYEKYVVVTSVTLQKLVSLHYS